MQSLVLKDDQEAAAEPSYCVKNVDEAEEIQTTLIHETGSRIVRHEYKICYDE